MQLRRIGRSLEQHGLIGGDLENAWLTCAGEARFRAVGAQLALPPAA